MTWTNIAISYVLHIHSLSNLYIYFEFANIICNFATLSQKAQTWAIGGQIMEKGVHALVFYVPNFAPL